LVELPSQHRLMALAGGDAVDAYPWWVSLSLPSVHAETGLSQVQILPARLNRFSVLYEWSSIGSSSLGTRRQLTM
jgi:hypothetical protein